MNQSAVSISAQLEIVFAAVREAHAGPVDLFDIVQVAPLHGPACVVVEGNTFRIERRGQVFLMGRFEAGAAPTAPTLASIHARVEVPEWAELAAELDAERRFFHMHPAMLASALCEENVAIERIGRVALGVRCGPWAWVHTTATAGGRTVFVYDHDGELVMRLDGIVDAAERIHARAG